MDAAHLRGRVLAATTFLRTILHFEFFKCWYKNIPQYTHHILEVTSPKHIFSHFNVSAAGLPLHPHLIGSDCLVWVLGNRGGFLQMVSPSP